MEEPEKKSSTGRNVAGFVFTIIVAVLLTIVAIPLLFFVACMALWSGGNFDKDLTVVAITLGVLVFTGLLYLASQVENAGVRWGLVVFDLALAAAAVFYLV